MKINFGKIFDHALRYPLKGDVFLIMLVFTLIFTFINLSISAYFSGEATFTGTALVLQELSSIAYIIPVVAVNWLVMIFLLTMYTNNSMKFFRGKREPVMKSIQVAKERYLPLLGIAVILGLIAVACFGSVIVMLLSSPLLVSEATVTASPFGTAFLIILIAWFLAGSVIGIYVMFLTSFAPLFCVLDKTGPMESIRKSWNLIGRNKLNTFVFVIIFLIIYMAISMIGSIPALAIMMVSPELGAFSLQSIFLAVINSILSTYLILFTYSADVNYYTTIKKKFHP